MKTAFGDYVAYLAELSIVFFLVLTVGLSQAITEGDNPDFKAGVGVIVNAGSAGNSTGSGVCGNNLTSCGTYPNCFDLSAVSYCVDGHLIESYCLNNRPQNRTRLTSCVVQNGFGINVTNTNGQNRQITIYLFSPGTTTQVGSNLIDGFLNIQTPYTTIDLRMDFDSSYLSILTKGVNITKIQSKNITILIDKTTPSIQNYNVYRAYLVELPSDLSFTSINMKIKYSDLTIPNDSSLVVLRCGNYNTATNTCNSPWEAKTISSIDLTNKIVSLDLTSFSVYALATYSPSPTTTTTTQPPQSSQNSQPSSSGSSSSSGGDFFSDDFETVSEPEIIEETITETPVIQQTTTTTTESKKEESTFFTGLGGAILGEGMLPIYLIASTIVGALYFFRGNFSRFTLYNPKVYIVRTRNKSKNAGRYKNSKQKIARSRRQKEVSLVLD